MPALRVTALAGGIGAARFLTGLLAALGESHPDAQVTVIGNTADDVLLHGMHISPDLDTVMYTLGGGVHPDQGWGRADETFTVSDELRAYGVGPDWFTLGDRDVATHVVRTQMLLGYPLSQVTAALCRRWLADLPVEVRLLPMSDDRVETHVVALDPETGRRAMHFQEWWVRYRAALPAEQIALVGIESATPAPGVVAAIEQADVVLLPPSNPVVSIGPILSVPGVRAAVAAAVRPGRRGVADHRRRTRARHGRRVPCARSGWRPRRWRSPGCTPTCSTGGSSTPPTPRSLGDLDGVGVAARAVPLLMSDAATTRAIAAEALDLALSLRA